MVFKYVPVMKNRQAEKEALLNQLMSENILPLIEMVIEKPRTNSTGDFATSHESFFRNLRRPVMVDIPMYLSLSANTKQEVTNFLSPIYNNPMLRVHYLGMLARINNVSIIPVASYNPNTPYSAGLITTQENTLRTIYPTLAFRVYTNVPAAVLTEIREVLQPEDIIILDIGESPHTQNSFTALYSEINNLRSVHPCKTVIVRSAIPQGFYNTHITDGAIITVADNSLINFYNGSYRFDAFGDCAGIRRAEIEDIPASSPAYITYIQANNSYVGYKGVYKQPGTFSTMVLPNYTASTFWTSLTPQHKQACYGCTLIQRMQSGSISPNTAVKWKTITIAHYIRSIDEIL
jgi:hypothetical protein